ncbi:Glycosyltransferase involved in cell wall bisynthesis [Catalinimonas alkaloidigena]|uniref:Glycosyltransferase involved in cell wall bisynthesis n=1 Tax=Catalinimonas alkaloidigena TaxID=1075417 RepID=A0A1G8WSM3_9BACT|nr:glycosyltransferase [Catalinimonas alkaloidigena]SDJ81211.1 Glycosyltransferase involved in cell wall bisynthesis [Catalinimonas alkaloidigena]
MSTTGVVIPCYNEAHRLPVTAFRQFAAQYPEICLCFVDDGSSDATYSMLQALRQGQEARVFVIRIETNRGKAEAVRRGMHFLLENTPLTCLGFLDADLATPPEGFMALCHHLLTHKQYQVVTGARIRRLGAEIERSAARHLIGRVMATGISLMLQLPFYDTQCGAKVFTREIAALLFAQPFCSSWLFDVELFFRLQQHEGLARTRQLVYEYPLPRWSHRAGSKITYRDGWQVVRELYRIWHRYRGVGGATLTPVQTTD